MSNFVTNIQQKFNNATKYINVSIFLITFLLGLIYIYTFDYNTNKNNTFDYNINKNNLLLGWRQGYIALQYHMEEASSNYKYILNQNIKNNINNINYHDYINENTKNI